jgi:hypothetical protein
MLPRLRLAPLAQVAAVLVAAILSGAPRVAGALAPAAQHQCRCGDHGPEHRCSCPICLRAAAEARAGDASLPPCHRAKARAEVEEAAHPPGPPGAPCLTGTCGALDPRPVTASGVEPFLPPPPAAIPAPLQASRFDLTAPCASRRVREPETPPPRLASRPGVHPRG